jgi:hypothetical protein
MLSRSLSTILLLTAGEAMRQLYVNYRWVLRSSVMLRSVDLWLVTEVSEQPIGPIFKGQAALDMSVISYQCRLRNTPEDESITILPNIGNYLPL